MIRHLIYECYLGDAKTSDDSPDAPPEKPNQSQVVSKSLENFLCLFFM